MEIHEDVRDLVEGYAWFELTKWKVIRGVLPLCNGELGRSVNYLLERLADQLALDPHGRTPDEAQADGTIDPDALAVALERRERA